MAGSRARSRVAPPTHKQEACARNMAQTARVKQSIAAQMQKSGAGIAGFTGGQLASAKQSHPATLLLFRASLSAPCTAPMGSAACGGAPKMPTAVEEGCAARTTLKCCYAQTTPDCPNKVVARRVCKKHGANGFCSFGNCKTAAVGKGRCSRHGGGSTKGCKVKDCNTLAKARGLCHKHGAYGTCTTKGCASSVQAGSQHCFKHGGGKKKPCSVAGCTTPSQRKGLCGKHGGGPGRCYAGNCTKQIVGMWMTCAAHGGHGECSHPSGCMYPVLKRTKKDGHGFCKRHADA